MRPMPGAASSRSEGGARVSYLFVFKANRGGVRGAIFDLQPQP